VLAGSVVVIASNMLIAWRESRLLQSVQVKVSQIP
jgi:hypothetical protein